MQIKTLKFCGIPVRMAIPKGRLCSEERIGGRALRPIKEVAGHQESKRIRENSMKS
jgi:hypothetical protein